jgi:hypothetical protein
MDYMRVICLICYALSVFCGTLLGAARTQPAPLSAFNSYQAGREFIARVAAINPFLPDEIRRKQIAVAVAELKAARAPESAAAKTDAQATATRMRAELNTADTHDLRAAVCRRILDLAKVYPDSAAVWDAVGEAESVSGNPYKGFVAREVAGVLDPATEISREAYFVAFRPVLAEEREARLLQTLAEVERSLAMVRDPKNSQQVRQTRLRAARVLVVHKLLREAPAEDRLTRLLSEITDLEIGSGAGK